MVVGLLDFDEDQRHAIDEQGDIGAELVIPVLAGQLGNYVKGVIRKVLKINQFGA